MNPSQAACLLLLLLSTGEIGVSLADSGIQPVDAVLLIDGAPTYLRLTNSTSLESVFGCVLENSQNVNSVIMSTQIKGVQMDVGRIEENVNEVIRLLSAEAGSNGRTLWKSPEELKLFKMRLARYLTTNYYDSKSVTERDAYGNFKSQRSADRLYKNRDLRSEPNLYGTHSPWQQQTHEPRRQYPIVSLNAPYLVTPESNEGRGITPTGSVSIPPATPASEQIVKSDAAVSPHHHWDFSATAGQQTTSMSSTTSSPDRATSPSTAKTSPPGIYPLKWTYKSDRSAFPAYGKIDLEIATGSVKETEAATTSSEGFPNVDKSNVSRVNDPATDFSEIEENSGEVQSLTRKRFQIGTTDATTLLIERNEGTESNRSVSDGGSSDAESEKQKKAKGKRKNSRKRLAKSRQEPSKMTIDPKANED